MKSSADCPTAECVFNNGVEMIPDHPFCAPAFMTDAITTIQRCIKSDKTTCTYENECKWRKGNDVAANLVFTPDAKLFEANMCHPPMEGMGKDGKKCFANNNQQACEQEQCIWSTLKELTPEKDFCAPAMVTQDFDSFMSCVTFSNDTAKCIEPLCKVY